MVRGLLGGIPSPIAYRGEESPWKQMDSNRPPSDSNCFRLLPLKTIGSLHNPYYSSLSSRVGEYLLRMLLVFTAKYGACTGGIAFILTLVFSCIWRSRRKIRNAFKAREWRIFLLKKSFKEELLPTYGVYSGLPTFHYSATFEETSQLVEKSNFRIA